MTKSGKLTTKTQTHQLTVKDGYIGKFDLTYNHIHQDEDLSRVNYYEPESEREEMLVRFERKGIAFEVESWTLRNSLRGLSQEDQQALQKEGVTHYIGTHKTIDGQRRYCIIRITEEEYKAIMSWFEAVSVIKKEKTVKKEVKSIEERYAKEIKQAKETGQKVIISRYTRDSQDDYANSDTEIVTVYIDSEAKITQTVALMD